MEGETTTVAGKFQNEYTAKIQENFETYEVEILDLGIASDADFRVVLSGTQENLDTFIEFIDDPRFVPEPPDPEPEIPEEPIDP